eukprot:CAMPEP_0197237078 /NCGR_PEP_ID=MMETSP1429-20130617/4010_1 /TAXON_ID=49237 /ORGANISM="Chaetoceros  sp., Strain UNC1202" /LENGTH=335 /DNA_ID=CAMNT_0042696005 /DNA_START=79 /DNA_END=1086 /DNA_ORIENTATION=+
MEGSSSVLIIGTIIVIILTSFYLFTKGPKEPIVFDDLNNLAGDDDTDPWMDEKEDTIQHTKPTTVWDNGTARPPAEQENLKNVSSVKQDPPNTGKGEPAATATAPATATNGSSGGADEKPFKSSYYYAHNQLKKSGGYKDGLKAEDYQMNAPKLLSKGGNAKNPKDLASAGKETESSGGALKKKIPKLNSISINRFLWDDDGGEEGIAKIYIDTLPDGKKWADTSITKQDVAAKFVHRWNDGLIIQIRSINTDTDTFDRYHLYASTLHGDAIDIKIIVKAKKLIVKLTKKRLYAHEAWAKDNLKVWPSLFGPPRKRPDGTDPINEDLFLLQEEGR